MKCKPLMLDVLAEAVSAPASCSAGLRLQRERTELRETPRNGRSPHDFRLTGASAVELIVGGLYATGD